MIAPVLKTGRPKGLVSSNLTPSAFEVLLLFFLCACFLIFDSAGAQVIRDCWFARDKSPNEKSARNPQDRSANDVRKVMRTEIHSREPDQNWDGETGKTDAATGEN